MRTLALSHRKVRGLRRRLRALERWAAAIGDPYPASLTPEDHYWNVKIPVLDALVEGPRARRRVQRQCVQRLIDAAASLIRSKPASATGSRVVACVCVPDLFSSEVCIYTDETYFQSKVQPSQRENERITPILGRSLAASWGLVVPPGMGERGVLWELHDPSEEGGEYQSELWFYGEVG